MIRCWSNRCYIQWKVCTLRGHAIVSLMCGYCCIPFANISTPSTDHVGMISPSLDSNRKKKILPQRPRTQDFSVETSLESFLQSLCIKWESNERSALAALWVFGSGIILYKESACSCRSRAQRNMPTFSQCKSRCGRNCWHEARAQGQMQIFHISFFKCLFRLRQGWYLAREYNTNLMKGKTGRGTEASVTYSSL